MHNQFENPHHGDSEEQAAAETQPERAVTVRELEDMQIFLEEADTRAFLGRPDGYPGRASLERGQELIREFFAAKDTLDSKTKEKLYERAKDAYIAQMESAVEFLDGELRALADEKEPADADRIRQTEEGIRKLKELHFWDLTQLKQLEELLEKVKKTA